MKKDSIIIGLVAVVVLAGVAWWALRPNAEAALKQEIADANYCTADTDCEVVTGVCPLGCWFAVNKAEAPRIQSLMDDFQSESTCIYSCIAHEGARCVSGSCEVVVPQP